MRTSKQLSVTLETQLRTEAASAYDELRADPAQALTAEQMRARLAQRADRAHRFVSPNGALQITLPKDSQA